jgi:DNA-binding NarL/FixJ family response regulator
VSDDDPLTDELRWLASHPLTRADREILPLLVIGLTDKEIAQQLGRSTKAMATRVFSLHQRLNVDTRAQAVYLALLLGLVTIPLGEAGERLREFRARYRRYDKE